ncbi:hypothetical protein [Streptomyces candidus]|uniref:Uncharacterized protein n=1 Tax=Streptomyces candidus TaxID=67283 RepID=A0A7X0HDD8_9ACTN|nr:hypothetical protein [Streptomyces candidus]MBB6435530.1 hypothetical protein [Streptomyces candidus]
MVGAPVAPGRARLLDRVGELVREARALGMSEDELMALVRANLVD